MAKGRKAGNRPASGRTGARRPAAGRRPAAAGGYRLFVRNLVLPARIGVHPYERELAQRIRLNVEILAADDCAAAGDDIAGVVSYEDVVLGVRRILSGGHINLVETLAERVAELCLADPRVFSVKVRVEKLDVFQEAESVGVEIERSRPLSRGRQ